LRSRGARFDDRLRRLYQSEKLAGVDEVGRGCLAGPVVVAAVILPPGCHLPGVRDSKKLSAARREGEFDIIRAAALCWAAVCVSVEEIDRHNILRASLLGMTRALRRLRVPPQGALIDGHLLPPALPCPGRAFVRGDDRSQSVAAASILAKVARDRLMRAWDRRFPGYGWAHNVGYPTAEHLRALGELGPTAMHRQSFAPVRRAALQSRMEF
jgi:ribonuclease HII